MRDTTTTTLPAETPTVAPLTAFGEDDQRSGLFTRPVDVSLLEALELDELGRRARWVPAAHLL
ncbi:MAG: hypothetical protein ACRDPC_23905 [Solirubrobacteraceae bacterium]